METATTPVIPQPAIVSPIDVTITNGAEYPNHLWRDVTTSISEAEAEVVKARALKREADAAYYAAMAQRELVQVPRDQMIATDRRNPAQIGRLAGIGRARCSQIRITVLNRMNAATEVAT